MRFLFLILSALHVVAFAEQSSNQLDLFSQNASYDGEALNLEGKIRLSHPLGTLTSDKASLIKETDHKKNKLFNSILLEKKVKLELPHGGILTGEKAAYDMENQKIEFSKVKNKIKYLDKLKKEDGSYLPFSIQSNKAYTNPLSFNQTAMVPFNFVDKVKVNIDNKIAIYGNEAICSHDKISIYPKNENSFCKTIYCNNKRTATKSGDKAAQDLKLFSKFLEFNLSTSLLYLEKPHGKIKEQMDFSSDKLYFNKDENKLTLDRNAVLKNDKFSLSSSLLDIYLIENKLQKVISSNDTKILFKNEKHSKITCISPILFDFEKNTASTTSINENSCFCYEDDDLMIFSKKANLLLSKSLDLSKTQSPVIELATLEQDVVIISKNPKENSYYGIADKLTYNPDKNLITLECLPEKKVIFLKNDNSLNLCADKIEIYHTQNIEEEKIKALGTVRFTLTIDEQSKLMESIKRYKDKI